MLLVLWSNILGNCVASLRNPQQRFKYLNVLKANSSRKSEGGVQHVLHIGKGMMDFRKRRYNPNQAE